MIFILTFSSLTNAKVYMSQEEFLDRISNNDGLQVESKTLWLNKVIQSKIIKILEHKYPKLRLRYKIIGDQSKTSQLMSVWFLEEIGKERPISFAIAVKDDQITSIQVLEFRESRGFEISIPSFANQFHKARLNDEGKLNKHIDGITGATMSVRAMKKIGRVALMLHKHINTNSN